MPERKQGLRIQLTNTDPQNIGLQAKILSERTFTMFVVMALVSWRLPHLASEEAR